MFPSHDRAGGIYHRGTGNFDIQATESASILLRTNNTTALTLTNTQNAIFTGNVGIGTTSPTSRLEIKATSATHQLVSINRPASDTAALYLGNDSASPANGVISSNYSDLIFGRDQSSTLSEWMRIKRDGNVGIGTTSPDSIVDIVGNNPILTIRDRDWET